MRPSTGTVCVFPTIFEAGDVEKFGEENLTLSSCTTTYAARLDPFWAILQTIVFSFFAFYSVPTIYFRMQHLYEFTQRKHVPISSTIQFKLYLALLNFSVLMILESIDIQGYRDWIPFLFYYFVDELVGVNILLIALIVVDFFCSIAQGTQNGRLQIYQKSGISIKAYAFFISVSFFNFVGLELLGVLFDNKYFIFEATKNLGTVCIALLILRYSKLYTDKIARFLGLSTAANGASAFPQKSSIMISSDNSLVNTALNKNETNKESFCSVVKTVFTCSCCSLEKFLFCCSVPANESPAKQLKRRFRRFASLTIFVSFVYTANAFLLFTSGEYEWHYDVDDISIGASLLFIRIFYIAVILVLFHLFPVPKTAATLTDKGHSGVKTKGLSVSHSQSKQNNSRSHYLEHEYNFNQNPVVENSKRKKSRLERAVKKYAQSQTQTMSHYTEDFDNNYKSLQKDNKKQKQPRQSETETEENALDGKKLGIKNGLNTMELNQFELKISKTETVESNLDNDVQGGGRARTRSSMEVDQYI